MKFNWKRTSLKRKKKKSSDIPTSISYVTETETVSETEVTSVAGETTRSARTPSPMDHWDVLDGADGADCLSAAELPSAELSSVGVPSVDELSTEAAAPSTEVVQSTEATAPSVPTDSVVEMPRSPADDAEEAPSSPEVPSLPEQQAPSPAPSDSEDMETVQFDSGGSESADRKEADSVETPSDADVEAVPPAVSAAADVEDDENEDEEEAPVEIPPVVLDSSPRDVVGEEEVGGDVDCEDKIFERAADTLMQSFSEHEKAADESFLNLQKELSSTDKEAAESLQSIQERSMQSIQEQLPSLEKPAVVTYVESFHSFEEEECGETEKRYGVSPWAASRGEDDGDYNLEPNIEAVDRHDSVVLGFYIPDAPQKEEQKNNGTAMGAFDACNVSLMIDGAAAQFDQAVGHCMPRDRGSLAEKTATATEQSIIDPMVAEKFNIFIEQVKTRVEQDRTALQKSWLDTTAQFQKQTSSCFGNANENESSPQEDNRNDCAEVDPASNGEEVRQEISAS